MNDGTNEQDELILATFPRGTAELRVTLGRFRGAARVDIRTYFSLGEELRPTRKGATFPVGELPALIEALEGAADIAGVACATGQPLHATANATVGNSSRLPIDANTLTALINEGMKPAEIARRLKVNRSTVHRQMKKLGLVEPAHDQPAVVREDAGEQN